MENENNKTIVRLSLTAPALTRLLGGDSEMEVRLRQQVVEQFADKQLKPLLNSDVIKKMIRDVEDHGRKMLEMELGKFTTGYNSSFILSPAFKERFEQQVKESAQKIMDGLLLTDDIQRYINRRLEYWQSYADSKVRSILDAEIERRIKDGIDKRLANAAAQK